MKVKTNVKAGEGDMVQGMIKNPGTGVGLPIA